MIKEVLINLHTHTQNTQDLKKEVMDLCPWSSGLVFSFLRFASTLLPADSFSFLPCVSSSLLLMLEMSLRRDLLLLDFLGLLLSSLGLFGVAGEELLLLSEGDELSSPCQELILLLGIQNYIWGDLIHLSNHVTSYGVEGQILVQTRPSKAY